MKRRKLFLILLIGIVVFSSCKKEKSEFARFRYTISVDGEKKVENYVSEENRCTFVGYTIHNDDTINYFRQISTCGATISIDVFEDYSVVDRQMHFEGNLDNGLEMVISGGENYPAPDFICGKVDLLHSDEEYIEGTFSGAFFRNYVFIDGDHSNRDYVKDTIWVEDGYFKVSVTETYDRVFN